jgi:hypothetical protein
VADVADRVDHAFPERPNALGARRVHIRPPGVRPRRTAAHTGVDDDRVVRGSDPRREAVRGRPDRRVDENEDATPRLQRGAEEPPGRLRPGPVAHLAGDRQRTAVAFQPPQPPAERVVPDGAGHSPHR